MRNDDNVDAIPTLVTTTRQTLLPCPSVPSERLADLAEQVHRVLAKLQEGQATLVNDSVAQATVDTALSSMPSLLTICVV